MVVEVSLEVTLTGVDGLVERFAVELDDQAELGVLDIAVLSAARRSSRHTA
jgi:hypothetical protein